MSLLVGLVSAITVAGQAPPAAATDGGAIAGGEFVPLAPARIVTARQGLTPPSPAANQVVSYPVLGQGGIPSAGVAAVALWVQAVGAANGDMTVWAAGAQRPATTNVSFSGSGAGTNSVITRVGPDGQISVISSVAVTELLIDVQGYYLAAPSPAGASFVALSPTRIYDTKSGLGGSAPVAGTVGVPVLGQGGVPSSGVSAVALNVTGSDSTAETVVRVWPEGPRPAGNALNIPVAGSGTALYQMAPGSNGTVKVDNSAGTIHIAVDVVGYYLAGDDSKATYVPLNATRIFDTSSGLNQNNGPGPVIAYSPESVPVRGVAVGGAFVVPADPGVTAAVVNITFTMPMWAGSAQAYPDGTTLPSGGTVASWSDFATLTVSRAAIVKVGSNGRIALRTTADTDVSVDILGYFHRPAGGQFVPLSPASIVDTSTGVGGSSGAVSAGSVRSFPVLGQGGIPASGVSAVALLVRFTAATADTSATIWANGTPRPAVTSVAVDTSVPTNSASVITKVGADGKIAVALSAGSANLTIGTQGYYTDTPTAGTSFVPVQPARIYDTKAGQGRSTPLGAMETVRVPVSGLGGVPASNVAAVVVSLTASDSTSVTDVRQWAEGPLPSQGYNPVTVQSGSAATLLVQTKVGSDGGIAVSSSVGTVHLAVDVFGYYLASAVGESPQGTYTPVDPAIVYDTTTGLNTAFGARALNANESASVPVAGAKAGNSRVVVPEAGVIAAAVNATAVTPEFSGNLSVGPDGSSQPRAVIASYGFPPPLSAGGTAVVKLGSNGRIGLSSSVGTDLQVAVQGYFSAGVATVPDRFSVAPGDGAVTLSWDAPLSDGGSAVNDYLVQYKVGASQEWSAASRPVGTSRTLALPGLVNGTSYDFRVAAVNAVGTGEFIAASGTPRTKPAAPTGLVPTAGDGQFSLSWSAPASTGGADLTGYAIQYKPTSSSTWKTYVNVPVTATTTSPVTGLSNGTTYDVRVAAVNVAGSSGWLSGTVTPQAIPAAPAAVWASAGDGRANLTWTAPSDGSAVTTYKITYGVASNPGQSQLVVAGPASGATVTGLANGSEYQFKVMAQNAAGTSTASPVATATPRAVPGAPVQVAVTPQDEQLSVTWAPPIGGETPTGYRITYWPNGDPAHPLARSVASGTTAATLDNLVNGTTYVVNVRALNSSGDGPASGQVQATPTTRLRTTQTGQPAAWSTTLNAVAGYVTTRATLAASGSGASGMAVVGNVGYFSENGFLRTVQLSTGQITTVAGTGNAGCTDATDPHQATVGMHVSGMASDGTWLYFIDACPINPAIYTSPRLRRMSLTTGAISTFGPSGYATAVTIGPGGSLLIGDNGSVQQVNWTAGTLTPVAYLPAVVGLAADATTIWAQVRNCQWICYDELHRIDPATGVTQRVLQLADNTLQRSESTLVSAGAFLYVAGADGTLQKVSKTDGARLVVAGAGPEGYRDGTGPEAWFGRISGVDTDGNVLWITDAGSRRVRRVAAGTPTPPVQPVRWSSNLAITTGAVTTVTGGSGGAGGSLVDPTGLSVFGDKTYFSDGARLGWLNADGTVTRLAGNGIPGCTDNPNPALATVGSRVSAMTNDGQFLYFIDECPTDSPGLTKPTLRRMAGTTGDISTFPGALNAGSLTVGPDGQLYAGSGDQVLLVEWARQRTTLVATMPDGPHFGQNVLALAAGSDGLWAVTANTCSSQDASNSGTCYHSIFRVDPATGAVNKVFQDVTNAAFRPLGPLVSAGNYLYTPGSRGTLLRFTKATGAWTSIAGAGTGLLDGAGDQAWFGAVSGLDTDGTSLLVLDRGNRRIRRVTPNAALPAQQPAAWSHGIKLDPAQADAVALRDDSGATATLTRPNGLTLVGDTGWFADAGYLRSVDVDSGVVRRAAGTGTVGCTDSADPNLATIGNGDTNMSSDGTFLYFIDYCPMAQGSGFLPVLRRMSLNTHAVSSFPGVLNATAFTIAGDGRLYAAEGAQIQRLDWATGTRVLVATVPPMSGAYSVNPVAMTADADALYLSSYGTCAGNMWSYDCSYGITRIDPVTGVVKPLFQQAFTSSDPAHPVGPLLSAGRYLYSAMSGGPVTGLAVWTKAGGWATSVSSPDGVPLDLKATTGLSMRGTDLYVLSADTPKLYRVHQAPAQGPRGLQAVGGGTGAGGAVSGPGVIVAGMEGTTCDTPVDQITGDFCASATDLGLAGRGGGLSFTRTYDTRRRAESQRLGMGWTDSYDWSLFWDGGDGTGSVTVMHGTGSEVVFHPDYSSSDAVEAYKGPNGAGDLRYTANHWEYTVADSTTYLFDIKGRLTGIYDWKSNTTITLNRDVNGRLVEASASTGTYLRFGYDAYGRIKSVTDPAGREVIYTYDANLDLAEILDANGGHWKVSYDDIHRITGITDPLGRANQVTYQNGRTRSYIDRAGQTTLFTYTGGDKPGDLVRDVADANGHTTRYTYRNNLLISEVHALGTPIASTATYEYDPATATIAAVTDNANHTTRYGRDELGNVLTQTDPIGRKITNTYVRYRLSTSTDVNGDITKYTYDGAGRGNVTSTTRTRAGGGEHVTTIYHHDDPAHPDDVTSITGPDGATTTLVHDPNGNVTATTDPTGRTTTATYNTLGWKTSLTTPGGHTTTYSNFTGFGAPRTVTDALGNVTTSVYNLLGNLTDTTDAEGRHVHLDYDNAGRLTATTAADGTVTRTGYDSVGNATTSTDELGRITRTAYDALNRPKTVTDPMGYISEVSYDTRGNIDWVKDAERHTLTTTSYDDANRVEWVTDALGHKVTYSYPDGRTVRVQDAEGRIVETKANYLGLRDQVTEGKAGNLAVTGRWTYYPDGNVKTSYNGHSTTVFGYDPAGRLGSSVDPAGRTTAYGYDADGNPATLTRPGSLVQYTYDPVGNLKQIDNPAGTPDVTYGYDKTGLRKSRVDGTGTTTYGYKTNGQLASVTNGSTTVGYDYNAAGEQTSITYPSGHTAVRTYDAAGRLSTVTDWTGRKSLFGWYGNGAIQSQQYPNGVTTRYSYDDNAQLKELAATIGNTPVVDLTYDYDSSGLLKQLTDKTQPAAPATRTYGWDGQSHLASLTGDDPTPGNFTIDLAGQLRSSPNTTFTLDESGQVKTSSTTGSGGVGAATGSYSYDNRGNRYQANNTPVIGPASGPTVTQQYGYNGLDQLTSYRNSSTPDLSVAYSYDGDGMRATTTRTDAAGTKQTGYVWDSSGGLPVLLADADNEYLYGPDNTPYAQINRATGEVTYLTADAGGSTRAITNASGATIGTWDYNPYGQITKTHTTATTTPFLYAGQYRDPDSGLYYLRARYYDPVTATFLTRDPAENATGLPYGYTAGNPLQYGDPTGLFWQEAWDAAKGVGSALAQIGRAMSDPQAIIDGFMNMPAQVNAAYEEGGLWLAVNQLNPFYAMLDHGAAAYTAAKAGDWQTAGKLGTLTAMDAASVLGVGTGGAALLKAAGSAIKSGFSRIARAERSGGVHPSSCFTSFSGNTRVLMADGSTKPISDIAAGDEVVATDPQTGVTGQQTVTDLWIHDDSLSTLAINNSALITTEDHPFWNQTRQEWERTDQLQAGDTLLAHDGRAATVHGLQPGTSHVMRAYNLTVSRFHTYYVLAGLTPVLVHNTNGEFCGAHGGNAGSPSGAGIVSGAAPAKAYEMLAHVRNRPGGIGKVSGYEGNGSWGNAAGDLPAGKYREWDVNAKSDLPTCAASGCANPVRGTQRLLTPKSGVGSAFYTPDHYGTFYYVGEM